MAKSFNDAEHYGITRVRGGNGGMVMGWLVFVTRRGQEARKMFYDGGHGGEQGALRAAQAYRDEWLASHPPLSVIEQSQQLAAHNTSGIPGVSRYINPRNGAPYWEAFISVNNKKIARTFAVNKWGEDIARDKAIAARQALLIRYQSDTTRLYSPAAKAMARVQHPSSFGLAERSPTLAQPVKTAPQVLPALTLAPIVAPDSVPAPELALGSAPRVSIWRRNDISVTSKTRVSDGKPSRLTRLETTNSKRLQGSSMTRSITAITPLGDQLLFSAMSGREEVSRLFEFQVELLSESHTVSPTALLGKSISLEIMAHKGGTRYLDGHCMRFAYLGNHGRFYKYQATLRPTLWYATRGSDMKVFQKKSVPSIIKEVLGKYPVALKLNLVETYRDWDYCIQYRESDFNFVSRLMENEGIHFHFEHSSGKHTLVLSDAVDTHKPFPGYASVPYYPPDATYSDNENDHFNSWLVTQAVDPGVYVTTEYDFKKPKADLHLEQATPKGHANATYEIYDFPGGYTELSDGEQYARVRMQALQHQQETVIGSGHMRGAAPGYLLSLTNQKRGDQNREYFVTACDYAMRDNQYEADGSGSYDFQVQMAAIPSSDPYQPKRITPKPHTSGPESAKIVGPKGEEIYTDKYGRVKVQFHWDRIGKNDENSSCWVRVSNNWAGSGFGAMYIPRIGQEVLIDFINGDPDRPIVTSRLYNEDNMPAWELPKHKTQSGIQTRWSQGGGGKHMLRFEDKKGIEHIELSTDHGNTHLHMGYLMNQGSEAKRSYGFELRTNEWGAVRADKGLLITTYTQDFKEKISHENPDGFDALGAGLSFTGEMMKSAKEAMNGAKDLVGALRDGRMESLKSLAQSAASATGGDAAAVINAATSMLGAAGSGGGETTTPDNPDPAMPDSQDILQKSKKIDKPIVSIVSPEGQSMISPKPIVLSSGQSTSVHSKSNITMSTGAQLTHLVKSGMQTHIQSGGQSTVVTSGDTKHVTAAGSLNLISKMNASLVSTTEKTHIQANKDVLVKSNTEAVWIEAPKKIVLNCGTTQIVMDGIAGTITMIAKNLIKTESKATEMLTKDSFLAKGKGTGALVFTGDLTQIGANINLNPDKS
jgi:type VI secretion system secreted protein VgrG